MNERRWVGYERRVLDLNAVSSKRDAQRVGHLPRHIDTLDTVFSSRVYRFHPSQLRSKYGVRFPRMPGAVSPTQPDRNAAVLLREERLGCLAIDRRVQRPDGELPAPRAAGYPGRLGLSCPPVANRE